MLRREQHLHGEEARGSIAGSSGAVSKVGAGNHDSSERRMGYGAGKKVAGRDIFWSTPWDCFYW